MAEQKTAKSFGYSIVPATRGGYHVKRDGRAVREGHRPLLFGMYELAKEYVKQQCLVLEDKSEENLMDRPILYAIVPDTDDRWMAMVLLPENLEIEEYRPTLSAEEEIRDLADMHPYVKQKYGESAVYASAGVLKELQQALRPWEHFHTPEMLPLLADNYTGNDLTLYCVYGSRSRPMSASWCKGIPGAVFIDADYAKLGYHTYVAVPWPLLEEQLQHYNLAFISGFHFSLELWVLLKDYEQAINTHDDGDDNHLRRCYIEEILDKAQILGFTFVHSHILDATQIVRAHPKRIINQEEEA